MASTNPIEKDLTADECKQLREYLDKMEELQKQEPEYVLGYEESAKEWDSWNKKTRDVSDKYHNVVIKAIAALINNYDMTNDSRDLIEILNYFMSDNQDAEPLPAGLLNETFLPMVNNNSINDFSAISKKDFKLENDFTTTATYTDPKGVKYAIENFDKLQGELGTPAKKILDTAILYLTSNNYGRNLSRASVEIPLIEYGEANGYNLTARKMPTKEEQDAENNRVADQLKDFKKMLRRDLKDLSSVQFCKDETRGKDAGNFDFGHIISGARIVKHDNKQYIRINFDVDMAQYFINSSLMQYPTILLKHDNRNPNAYAIGRKIALQNSNDNNVAIGTDNTLKVKTLLEAAPEIISYEALRAKGRRDWKKQIKERLERALNSNVEIGYIIRWKYRNARTGERYTPETANALTWEEYYNLDVDFILIDNPAKEERLQKKKEEKAIAAASNPGTGKPKKRGRPPKNKKS